MKKNYSLKVELNSSTHFYDVDSDLNQLHPEVNTVLANCINCRERSYNPNSDNLEEIEVAIYVGLCKLGIDGLFHRGPYDTIGGIVKRMIGGIGI